VFVQAFIFGAWVSTTSHQRMGIFRWQPSQPDDLDFLGKLFENGQVKPVIDSRYPLSEVPDAVRRLESGRARGKIVITVITTGET
jgi:NADPH:quinone reductase-like Zn-dependent oxidoreductase